MSAKRLSQLLMSVSIVSMTISSNAAELDFGTRVPSTQKLIEHLAPKDNQAKTLKYRGIEIKEDAPELESADQEPNAASLQVLFEFDSYALTPAAIEQLHPLGMALQSTELEGLKFLVEGHTDAVGPLDYNLVLSKNRALTIKNHLVANYNIPGQHLQAVGVGEEDLLVPAQPEDARNRRVRIVGSK